MARRAKQLAARLPDGTTLNGPRTCGEEPAKSTVMAPSPTVTATSMRMRRSRSMPSLSRKSTCAVGALRNRAQRVARHRLGAVEQLGEDRRQMIVAVGVGERGEPPHADRAGRDLRHQVALERVRDAHVAPQDLQQRVVELHRRRAASAAGAGCPPGKSRSRWSAPSRAPCRRRPGDASWWRRTRSAGRARTPASRRRYRADACRRDRGRSCSRCRPRASPRSETR